MEKIKTFFKRIYSLVVLSLAYLKAAAILLRSVFRSLLGKKCYKISFTKIGRKWYCDVPGWPEALFERTLMVGGASTFINDFSDGGNKVTMTVFPTNNKDIWTDRAEFVKISSSLLGGAFYRDRYKEFREEVWLCPVTLFMLGYYPKRIIILQVNEYQG